MTRHGPALLALSIVAVAGWTYNVNYDTRAALDRLSVLRGEIAEEREALQVLRVEWAYLNAPDRLAALVVANNEALGLAPLLPEALAIAASIPYPPREIHDAGSPAPDALVAADPPAAAATAPTGTAQAALQAPRTARAGLGPETTIVGPAAPQDSDGARRGLPSTVAAEPETIRVAALAPRQRAPAGSHARSPAAAGGVVLASLPAAPVAVSAEGERVPAALEAAIAAALVEAGVGNDGAGRSGAPRAGAAAPARILGVAAPGVPMPAARPGAWSRQ